MLLNESLDIIISWASNAGAEILVLTSLHDFMNLITFQKLASVSKPVRRRPANCVQQQLQQQSYSFVYPDMIKYLFCLLFDFVY